MQEPLPPPGFSMDEAVSYHSGRFPPKTLDYQRLMPAVGEASLAAGRYDSLLKTLPNQELLLAPLRSREAVASSRIEGTVATLEEVFALEDAEQDTARPEVLEVLSYVRAMARAERLISDGLPICSRLIREAHGELLFSGRGADKRPGQFKQQQNYIVDRAMRRVVFVPIPPQDLQEGLRRFENFMNASEQNPLIRAALGHAEFEALHPFGDGNGRIGRMLITLSLWKDEVISRPYFYVSSEIEKARDEYIDQLRAVSARNTWTEWCLYFLDILARQANENIALADRMQDFYNEMKELFPNLLSSPWAVRALDGMFANPVFTNRSFSRRTGVPPQSAGRFTRTLAEHNVLKIYHQGSGRRPTLFVFQRLLEIVRP